jgi:signal transduction histidine kinase
MNTSAHRDKIALLRLAFQDLDEQELENIAGLTEFHTYPAGHTLCHEGEYEEIFYIVSDGMVSISKKLGDDEGEHILRESGRGTLVGEMALIQDAPRSGTVRTMSECTTLEMGKHDFETILSRSPQVAINIIRITLDRLRANDQTSIAELSKNIKILRQLDRNKTEFIQVTAHELRTPLTVMKGYISLLSSIPELQQNPALSNILEGITSGTNRMHEIVNLMLDLSRIDEGSVKLTFSPVLISQVVGGLLNELSQAISERKLKIEVTKSENTIIHADPVLVEKAIYHLLLNAIKYTPDGGKILIATRAVTMENNTPAIEIMVRDTGIGLDAEHHKLVFEKFYQVGSVSIHSSGKTSFKGGGPGLGLAIVRGVARAHGGKVWVESPGYDEARYPGSTFYLQLPIDPPLKS